MENNSSEFETPGGFHRDLVVSGVRWSGVIQILSESVRIIGSIILARILAPEDFGLMAMAIVITGFLAIFQYMGTGGIIIQKKELPDALVNSLFIVNLAVGAFLFLVLLASGSLLAGMFNTGNAAPVIRVMGLVIFISSAGIVQYFLITRRMRFDLFARVKFAEVAANSVISIALAYMGWGVWALVAASLGSTLLYVIYLWVLSGWRPSWLFSRAEIKRTLGFGLNLTGSDLIEFLIRNLDRLIVGRWLGSVSLGYYSIASKFCLFPLESIAPVLTRVLFPAFSRVQDDYAQLQKIFLRACGGIAFITFPLMAGLCVVAGPFVLVLLGPKWQQTIPVIRILTIVGILRTVSAPSNDILLARGRSDWLFRVLLISGVALALGMYIGLARGLIGVAFAYAIVTLPAAWLRLAVAMKAINLRFAELLSSLGGYIISTILMSIIVLGGMLLLEKADFARYLILVISVSLGIVVYSTAILLIRPAALFDFLKIIPLKGSTVNRIAGLIDKIPGGAGKKKEQI